MSTRNLLLGKKLEFGNYDQIQAVYEIDIASKKGFLLSPHDESFKCFKCKKSLDYYKSYSCHCGYGDENVTESDDHEFECGWLVDAWVIEQKITCRTCKAKYYVKEDINDDSGYGTGFIEGLL